MHGQKVSIFILFTYTFASSREKTHFCPQDTVEKDALNNLLLKLLAQCLCISIPIQTPFDFFWAFRACTPCWLYGTTKAESKSRQDLSLYTMWYKCMQWIKMRSSDRSLKNVAYSLPISSKQFFWTLILTSI